MNLRRLEEISQNASRPERGLMIDGWSVGLSPGIAKRSRCVNPFYPSTRPFAENLATAKAAFASAGLPCVFRLTPFVADLAIDTALDAIGCARFDTTLVQALPLAELRLDHIRPVAGQLRSHDNFAQAAAWVGEMRGDNPAEAEALAVRWRYCAGDVKPLFAYDQAGARIARSVSITEDGHIGIFDVGTLSSHRNRGFAGALIAHQLSAARDAGVHTAYLQVTPENPSRSLYERFGFRTVYEYWYRALPDAPK